jgi:NADH-quinone oxidoreductase subunit E
MPQTEIQLETDMREVDRIIDSHMNKSGALTAILQAFQERFSYLPKDALEQLSTRLQIPMSRVYHVATFYKAFSFTPRGRHRINVCVGTACHVRGAQGIVEHMERELKISAGETTKDLRFTLDKVRCIGCCSLAPVITINNDTHGRLTQNKSVKLLKRYP